MASTVHGLPDDPTRIYTLREKYIGKAKDKTSAELVRAKQ